MPSAVPEAETGVTLGRGSRRSLTPYPQTDDHRNHYPLRLDPWHGHRHVRRRRSLPVLLALRHALHRRRRLVPGRRWPCWDLRPGHRARLRFGCPRRHAGTRSPSLDDAPPRGAPNTARAGSPLAAPGEAPPPRGGDQEQGPPRGSRRPFAWRCRPDLNRCSRFCRPVPNPSATAPCGESTPPRGRRGRISRKDTRRGEAPGAAGLPGLEPGTLDLEGRRSIRLSYRPSGPSQGRVGAAGFEPTTSCSQSRRATGLRYAPRRPPRRPAQRYAAGLA